MDKTTMLTRILENTIYIMIARILYEIVHVFCSGYVIYYIRNNMMWSLTGMLISCITKGVISIAVI